MLKLCCCLLFLSGITVLAQFHECYNDGGYVPKEGTVTDLSFTWLGILQYVHIKNGTPHYFRAPRVVLISKQFVLSTAYDASEVPEGYALGNVVFGDYERDEEECQITAADIHAGAECHPAVLIMPVSDVLLHPEYKHFGSSNSLAILKLMTEIKSNYMLPACLPFKDFTTKRNGRRRVQSLYYIDFVSDVPRDFMDEDKEVRKLSLLPKELCYLYNNPVNGSKDFVKDRMACTSGCNTHSGAPSVVHERNGFWSIVALAFGGSPCPDPLRPRRPSPPPHHILIHPYVAWITTAITSKAVGSFDKNDPFGFAQRTAYDIIGHQWSGHWWMGGLRCYDRGDAADDLFKFYQELFNIKPLNVRTQTHVNYFLELSAPEGTSTVCVKVGMPYRLGTPIVTDLDTPIARVSIPAIRLFHTYIFHVEAWAYNISSDSVSESRSDCSDSNDSECITVEETDKVNR